MAKGGCWREMRLGVPTCRLFPVLSKDPACSPKKIPDVGCGGRLEGMRAKGQNSAASPCAMRDESLTDNVEEVRTLYYDVSLELIVADYRAVRHPQKQRRCTCSALSNLVSHLTGISICRHEEECLTAAQNHSGGTEGPRVTHERNAGSTCTA